MEALSFKSGALKHLQAAERRAHQAEAIVDQDSGNITGTNVHAIATIAALATMHATIAVALNTLAD